MSPRDWKSSHQIISLPVLAAVLFFLCAPAGGAEGVKGTKGEATTKDVITTEKTGTGDTELAAARLRVKEDPSNASGHIRLAMLLLNKGALDEAMLSFNEALKLNPRSHDAKTGRGIVLARKGNLQEAEKVFKDALLLNPNPVRTHYELGLVYEKLGDLEKAAAEFKEGIRKHEQGR